MHTLSLTPTHIHTLFVSHTHTHTHTHTNRQTKKEDSAAAFQFCFSTLASSYCCRCCKRLFFEMSPIRRFVSCAIHPSTPVQFYTFREKRKKSFLKKKKNISRQFLYTAISLSCTQQYSNERRFKRNLRAHANTFVLCSRKEK